jgi:uroporphyrin-III C-methyltransferase/precorrin-2 dehydrogenase/sirohydrochlorin ferrochelatase
MEWAIKEPSMTMLPIFLKLDGRNCLLVGAGTIALEKIGTLLATGPRLRIVAPDANPEIRRMAAEGVVEWIEKKFESSDLQGMFLVIAATNDPAVNQAVYRAASDHRVLCNSVDDVPNCDFYFGSVVTRGDLQIAISTAGQSPAVAQRLRREIDDQLPADLGPWLAALGDLRREVLATHPRGEERKALLHQLAERQICDSDFCTSRLLARAPLTGQDSAACGTVSLVGAGPGDPDLLTLKALRAIQSADVILHDDLVPPAILSLAKPHAEVLNVGKRCGSKSITQDEINASMIEHARNNRAVVRLKSGDPLVFGRAAEEIEALNAAGVPFEIVPGITAAFAAAAAVGRSLTDRRCASSVVFSTGHHAQSHNNAPLPQIEDATRVVYMPGRDLELLAEQWIQEGLPADFPCAVISHAAQPEQEVHYTTLAGLAHMPQVGAPSLLIAGWCVASDLRPGNSVSEPQEIPASIE